MSDNLREALEELAAKWEAAGFPPKATELRAQIAAHPDETTTQWGRGWETEGKRGVEPRKSKESALNQIELRDGVLVYRKVTPWKVECRVTPWRTAS